MKSTQQRKPQPSDAARSGRLARRWIGAVLALGLAACGGSTTMELGLSAGTTARLAGDLPAQRALETELQRLFGTPAGARYLALEAWEAAGFDPNAPGLGRTPELIADAERADNERRFEAELEALSRGELPQSRSALAPVLGRWSRAGSGDLEQLAEAVRNYHPTLTQSAQTYQRLCVTCHGREGGGNGPGSRIMNPPPRDFRSGEFKHFASEERARPDQAELVQVLHRGVTGTSMPPFKRHSTAELSGLADFVRWLSLRGRVEARLTPLFAGGARPTPEQSERVFAEEFAAWGAPALGSDPARAASGSAPEESSAAQQDASADPQAPGVAQHQRL